ncbi:MAG: hypothetical protein HY691_10980 [Chloroflexi bacterium]|nr:hypothetical protein [Chloroflexota bacterium]
MADWSVALLLGTALLLGLQHGVDWDHLAAISDITSTMPETRRGLLLGTLYVLGHAAVVVTIGLLAIWAGLELPEWVDSMMEPFVGATLVFLGLYIIYSLARDREHFHMRSRWMLLFDGLRTLWDWAGGRLRGRPQPAQPRRPTTYGMRTAVGVGMIHGVGAETPSQVLLFLAAAGAGGHVLGSAVLLVFVLGLVLANSAITVGSLFGYARARRHRRLYVGAGVLTAVLSMAIGLLFLTGQGALLPPIVGG